MNNLWTGFQLLSLAVMFLYGVPYLIRRGWGDAENKTKKVCDTCFRDLNKWNEFVKANSRPQEKEEVG